MDKNSVLFGILASILIGGSLGLIPIQNSFAEDDDNFSDREDSDTYKKQLEKAEKEKKKDEERKQQLEEKQKEQREKAEERKQQLEEKQKEQREKADEKKKQLEEKRKEQQQRAEEKRKKLEEKKTKLESDRKKLEEKLSDKINEYEDKLNEIKEKYQNKIESKNAEDVEKFSAATAKLEDKIAEKSEKIREKLAKKLDKLDTRTQKILDKINDGDYLGKKIGSSTTDTYELVFDSVETTAIHDKTQTSSLTGFMSFTTFDKGKSNLKLELQECQITVDDVPYNCGFGKARTASSGDSGAKDSLVILAFLEDDVLEEVHSTLKILLNADSAIRDIDDSSQVSILGPQSKIAGMWFLEGEGTLTKIVSDSTDDSTRNEISVELTEEIGISEN